MSTSPSRTGFELGMGLGCGCLAVVAAVVLLPIVFMAAITALGTAAQGPASDQTAPAPERAPTPEAKATTPKRTAEQQGQFERYLQKLIDDEIFTKVEFYNNVVTVWVGPAFYRANFEDKSSHVAFTYVLHFSGSDNLKSTDFVCVRDSMTGKEIGQFSHAQGGLKLN